MPTHIKPVGKTPNLPLNNDPGSGWREAADWKNWQAELPNAYVYRLRAVSASGTPLPIPAGSGVNHRGLLYVGETGVREMDPSQRLGQLAHGVSDKAYTSPHGAAKRFWADDWATTLAKIDPNYHLEVGWDEQVAERVIAGQDESLPAAKQTEGMTSHSGKAAAQGLEDLMLRQYDDEYGTKPPLNRAKSPGFSDKDRKTKHTAEQDFEARTDGEVETDYADSEDGNAMFEAARKKKDQSLSP